MTMFARLRVAFAPGRCVRDSGVHPDLSSKSRVPLCLARIQAGLPMIRSNSSTSKDLTVLFGCSSAMTAMLILSRWSNSSCDEAKSRASGSGMTVLRVEGMGCQGCVGRAEKALLSLRHVSDAHVDLKSKLAYVTGCASAEDLISAVKSTGKTAMFVGSSGADGFVAMTPQELKTTLAKSGQRGLVLDIDETLSATNVAWFQRLVTLFGNPDDLPLEALISQYHLAQNVPFWQTKEALAWMQQQRDDPKAQDNLPLIAGSVEGVHGLRAVTPIVGYCTVRPDAVNANTIAWLQENGFPDMPVVAKPASVPFADGNKWKAAVLHQMWPEVCGIVDDNPKLPFFAGKDYPGTIFLFGHATCPSGLGHAIPCSTWPSVVSVASSRA